MHLVGALLKHLVTVVLSKSQMDLNHNTIAYHCNEPFVNETAPLRKKFKCFSRNDSYCLVSFKKHFK